MRVIPIRSFPHDRRGQMAAGRVYDVDEAEGRRLMSLRLVRVASPDEGTGQVAVPQGAPGPSPAGGEAQPSSASPAAQASPQTTAKPSAAGGKKKGKKRGGA